MALKDILLKDPVYGKFLDSVSVNRLVNALTQKRQTLHNKVNQMMQSIQFNKNSFCFNMFLYDKYYNEKGRYFDQLLVFDLVSFLFAAQRSKAVLMLAARKMKHIVMHLEQNHNINKSNLLEVIPVCLFERCLQLGLQSDRSNFTVFNEIFQLMVGLAMRYNSTVKMNIECDKPELYDNQCSLFIYQSVVGNYFDTSMLSNDKKKCIQYYNRFFCNVTKQISKISLDIVAWFPQLCKQITILMKMQQQTENEKILQLVFKDIFSLTPWGMSYYLSQSLFHLCKFCNTIDYSKFKFDEINKYRLDYLIKLLTYHVSQFRLEEIPSKIHNFWIVPRQESEIHNDESKALASVVPTPDRLRMILKKWSQYMYYKRNSNVNMFVTIETIYKAIDQLVPSGKAYTRRSQFKKDRPISLNMTFLVVNIMQDLRTEELLKNVSKLDVVKDARCKIPMDIWRLILDYEDSIVAMDMNKGNGEIILKYETYGTMFGYYPKILNWSLSEMEANIDIITKDIQDNNVLHCWVQYLNAKKRKIIGMSTIQQRVNQVIFHDLIQKYSQMSSFLIHNPKCYQGKCRVKRAKIN